MFRLENGKLAATVTNPYESAGFMYYFKAPDGSTKVMLFERENAKKKRLEFELGTFGKSDYQLIKDTDETTKAVFLQKVITDGQEPPLATALREGREETDGVINSESPNQSFSNIVTTPHKCWCNMDEKISTIISVAPYELTTEQYNALISKAPYKLFTRAVAADLRLGKDGKLEIVVDGVNLLEQSLLKDKWRSFTALLLSDETCNKVVFPVLSDMVKNPSLLQASKKEEEEKQNTSSGTPDKNEQDKTTFLQRNRSTIIAGAAVVAVAAVGVFGVARKGGSPTVGTPDLPVVPGKSF